MPILPDDRTDLNNKNLYSVLLHVFTKKQRLLKMLDFSGTFGVMYTVAAQTGLWSAPRRLIITPCQTDGHSPCPRSTTGAPPCPAAGRRCSGTVSWRSGPRYRLPCWQRVAANSEWHCASSQLLAGPAPGPDTHLLWYGCCSSMPRLQISAVNFTHRAAASYPLQSHLQRWKPLATG